MTDIFRSAKSVLSRANHHIADLENAIKVFSPDKPYTHSVEHDLETGHYVHVLRFSESFSDDISCIMFDAVNNLRASLDQMTYAIAVKHRGAPEKWAYFPFAKDAHHWPNRINGLKNDLPPEITAIFDRFKPYKGGNDTLWALNEIANTKKHAILVPVDFGSAKITLHTESHMPDITLAPPFLAKETELIIYRSPDPPERHPNIEITYGIIVRHPEPILHSQSPVPLLNAMSVEVARIVLDTEVTCRRIGLVT